MSLVRNDRGFAIPRLPVMGWQTFGSAAASPLPCLLDHPHKQLTTSGRAAILLALDCLGVGPGDVVLVPAYHCPTMVAPVLARGAQPLFYPIDEQGAARLDWLREHAPAQARVLLATHFFGLPQPMQGLRDWCDQRGLALIEDCAHALFGRSGSRAVGHWGDLAIASLTKFLPTPEGGCLVVNRAGLPLPQLRPVSALAQLKAAADILHVGAAHGRLPGLNGLVMGVFGLRQGLSRRGRAQPDAAAPAPAEDEDVALTRIDEGLARRQLSAACAWVAGHVPRARIVATRRRHYEAFARAFAGQAGLHPLLPQLQTEAAPYVFPLWVDQPDPGYLEMRRLGVPVSRWDRLWPGVPELPGDMGPRWSHHVLQLACHQDLGEDELARIIETVLRLFARRNAAA